MICKKRYDRLEFSEGDVVKYFYDRQECYGVILENRGNTLWCRDVTDNSYVDVPIARCVLVRRMNE